MRRPPVGIKKVRNSPLEKTQPTSNSDPDKTGTQYLGALRVPSKDCTLKQKDNFSMKLDARIELGE